MLSTGQIQGDLRSILPSELRSVQGERRRAIKILSIKQPRAWLICAGYVDIENRSWPTEFRGRVYVHAGKRPDIHGIDEILANLKYGLTFSQHCQVALLDQWCESAIIGEVNIVDCVSESKSPWFTGKYGLVLSRPTMYIVPIPCSDKWLRTRYMAIRRRKSIPWRLKRGRDCAQRIH